MGEDLRRFVLKSSVFDPLLQERAASAKGTEER